MLHIGIITLIISMIKISKSTIHRKCTFLVVVFVFFLESSKIAAIFKSCNKFCNSLFFYSMVVEILNNKSNLIHVFVIILLLSVSNRHEFILFVCNAVLKVHCIQVHILHRSMIVQSCI